MEIATALNLRSQDNSHILVAASEVKTTTPLGKNDVIIENFSAGFENLKARFIRVIAVNIKTCPEWHVGKGSKAWVFADEVVVNGRLE